MFRSRVHAPSLLARIVEQLRSRSQRLVRAGFESPLLLLSYRTRDEAVAEAVADAYTHLFPSLPDAIAAPYRAMLAALPPMVVVLLRPANPCDCLGHHHPDGTETRLARRLKSDMGGAVGEIDLAFESIRKWQPHPLSSLAAGEMHGKLAEFHFQAALLAVLLHELEHLAHPDHSERQVRTSSNDFYAAVMDVLVHDETGGAYGMIAP